MAQIFEMDDDGNVDLRKEWIKLNPRMKVLYDRDTGSVGDSGGRLKKQAKKEFNYIRMMWDPNSEYESYPVEKRRRHVLEVLELNGYKADEDLQIAEEEYRCILKELRTYRAWAAATNSLDAKIASLETYQPDARDKMGKLLMTPEQHSKALKAYKDDLQTVEDFKALLDKEIKQEIQTKSTLKKGLREDRKVQFIEGNKFIR